jgi:uncharacterized protein (TIGR00725 family)
MNRRAVAVCGNNICSEATYEKARRVGRLLAENNITVFTGGLGGVMEAAHKGAREAGGLTVGILPGYDTEEANEYVQIPIATGMGHARNAVLVSSAVCIIAVEGAYGTLSEIALALKLGRPVIGLGTWDLGERGRDIRVLETPEQAAELAAVIVDQRT